MSGSTAGQPQAWWREPTKDQWIAFAAAWLGWILDAFDFTVFLLVMPQIAKEFGASSVSTAGSVTLTLLFRLAGGYLAGLMADRWGRRLPLMISIIWFAVCDGAVYFAPSFAVVLALRAIFGLGMGAEWTAGATLAMESWPVRSRGIASGVLQGSWALGYLLAAQVYGSVVPQYGWRAIFLVAALPALMALPIRFFVRESDDWKKEKAARPETSFRDLRAPGLVKQLAWASGVMALGFGGYYGFISNYTPLLLQELHQPVVSAVTCFNVGMMVGAIACGVVAARKGPMLAIILPAMLVLPVAPLYVGMVGGSLALGPFALGVLPGALLGGAVGGGYAGVTPLLLTSLFPVRLRARCVGIVYHVGAMPAAFVPPLIALLHERYGLPWSKAILLVVVGCNLALALALLLRPRNILAPIDVDSTAVDTTAAVAE